MSFYVGCPVWSFKGWVGNFYPTGTKPADFLSQYAKRLTDIEGNTTFYAIPAMKTIEARVADTPETFRFCPKNPKAISHAGRLTDHIDAARGFVDVMRGLGTRLGPMYLQLPPRFSPNLLAAISAFLSAWSADVRLAIEVRHLDWCDPPHEEALNGLLAAHNMARVSIDTRPIRSLAGDESLAGSAYESLLEARENKPDVPVVPMRTSDFVFVRYIGHPDLEIDLPFIEEWAGYFSEQIRQEADVFAFCHSPDNRIAPYLCRELHRRVAQDVDIPPLPWDALDPDVPEQPSLF
ncbi:MAG: DUF72 domain-containing protein [Anaerolineae bacterium]|nr:DUF72 domain-containing protein [Anaerolineae bacterium]